MKRPLLLGLVVGLLLTGPTARLHAQGLPAGDAREAGFDPEKLGRIGAMLEEAASARKIAGGSALVARHGKVVGLYKAGMRDLEAGRPMTEDTIVRIASMTKPITSAAIMVLVDEGKVRLDDPVSKYLPAFRAMKALGDDPDHPNGGRLPDAKRPITIHHLLTHTSGLTYRFFNKPILADLYVKYAVSDGLAETPGTIGDNAERLSVLPLMFHPGDRWEYSLATDVLGRVVEVASGMTLDEFLRCRIFEPLEMRDTHFLVPADKRDRLAWVYQPGEGGKVRRTGDLLVQQGPLVYSATYPTWDDGRYYSGGAGLCSTLGDYARFLQMLLNRGELDGARVLKPETVDLMTRNQIGDLPMPSWGHGDRFGYGFGVVTEAGRGDDPASVGSYSWAGFFYTYFWVDPKREIIGILFTQTYPNGGLSLREGLKRTTYEALTDKPQ
jgi:CubicO group peptidase (beta-lactamase class C family)